MKNFNNCVEIEKINSQLEKAEKQKSRLIRSIYREYELYLNLVRHLIYISAEKGINEILSNTSINENFSNANEFFCFFEKKISKLIQEKLPLMTVEQLIINKNEKNINKEIANLPGSPRIEDAQKEKFQDENDIRLDEPVQFQISEDISNTSEYYQVRNYEKLSSLDLDKDEHDRFLSNKNIFENTGLEKQFISSLLELIEELKVEKARYSENYNINQMDLSPKHQSFKNFDLIEKSLDNLLLNLSYKINLELFKAKIIKNIISQDSFEYLVGKKLLIKHLHPFVINFELDINHSSSKGDNHPSIIFFNISIVELEYKNLNLSIQRNKINELKNQFQRLIKKETYWRQKEITLNKIH